MVLLIYWLVMRKLVRRPLSDPHFIRRQFDWTFGIWSLLVGTALALWIGYNLLVERRPETEGTNPLIAVLFALGLLYFGVVRIRRALRRYAATERRLKV